MHGLTPLGWGAGKAAVGGAKVGVGAARAEGEFRLGWIKALVNQLANHAHKSRV